MGNSDIQGRLAELGERFGVRLSYALHNLTTGERWGHQAHDPVETASTYKLPLLLHVARQVEAGALSWDQPLPLEGALRSYGTGVLKDLTPGLTLPLRDVCRLMIVLSDNTATNLLVNAVGLEAVNFTLADLGLTRTRLIPQPAPGGVPLRPPLAAGITTPAEMVTLLEGLQAGTLVSPASSSFVLTLLGDQQDRTMIPRFLPPDWSYAGKTGANPDLRSDVGIVRSPEGQAFLLAVWARHPVSFDWSVESPGTLAVARLARQLLLPERESVEP